MADNTALYADRSRMATRQKCVKERYLGYDYEGTGISKRGSKYDAEFGIIFHQCMADMLTKGKVDESVHVAHCDLLGKIIEEAFKDTLTPEQLQFMQREQVRLLSILVCGFEKYRLAPLLQQYDVVTVEEEKVARFEPGDYLPYNFAQILKPLTFPIRLDALLRDKQTGMLFICDFKTTKNPSTDWNVALDNSLQSHLYVEAVEHIYGEYVGGIFYAGAVKGYREMDKAISSPYKGNVIQYGSCLYGWKDKNGQLHKDYVKGRTRQSTIGYYEVSDYPTVIDKLVELGWDMPALFPMTIPWKPIAMKAVVGQQIVAENTYQGNLEMLRELPKNSPAYNAAEAVLMEQSLDSCFKYGSKHPCPFLAICHGAMHKDEIAELYEPRIPHHESEGAE
jgi:hypothetical protein